MVYLAVLAIIAVISAVYFCVRFLSMKRALDEANAELLEITQELEENRIVKLSNPSRDTEKLLVTINALLEQIRKKAVEYRAGEQRLKKEVESISHDLRTPLTSILGYLKLIDFDKLGDEERASLEVVRQKASALQRLITQFYDLSRISADSYEFQIEDVDVARLLREHITANYALLPSGDFAVSIEIPDEPVKAAADVNALERIIHNLLHNAGKFAKSAFKVSLAAEGGRVVIVFENDVGEGDDGCSDGRGAYGTGGARSAGSDADNTGLGLMIARGLAEGMGGTLDVERDAPEGSAKLFRAVLSMNERYASN